MIKNSDYTKLSDSKFRFLFQELDKISLDMDYIKKQLEFIPKIYNLVDKLANRKGVGAL